MPKALQAAIHAYGSTKELSKNLGLDRLAIQHNAIDAMRVLLRNGVDPIANFGIALGTQNEDIMILMLEFYKSKSPICPLSGFLIIAAEAGHHKVIKKLIEIGAETNFRDGGALRAAAKAEREETVRFLIAQGADLETAWAEGQDIPLLEKMMASKKMKSGPTLEI